jgi:hypothetical protein
VHDPVYGRIGDGFGASTPWRQSSTARPGSSSRASSRWPSTTGRAWSAVHPERQSQGLRGEVHPLLHVAFVAHHDSKGHRRGAAPVRPVRRAHRRLATALGGQAGRAPRPRGRRRVLSGARHEVSERGGRRRTQKASHLFRRRASWPRSRPTTPSALRPSWRSTATRTRSPGG